MVLKQFKGSNLVFVITAMLISVFAEAKGLELSHNDFFKLKDFDHAFLGRVYSSESNISGLFGKGWSFVLNSHVSTSGDRILFTLPSGKVEILRKSKSTKYINKNYRGTFTGEEYKIVDKRNTLYQFDKKGRLVKYRPVNSQKTYNFSYLSGRIRVLDSNHAQFKIVLQNDKISKIELPNSIYFKYSYDGEKLKTVFKNKKIIYDYKYDQYFNITNLYDNGKRSSYSYNKHDGSLVKDQELLSNSNLKKLLIKLDKNKRIGNIVISENPERSAKIGYSRKGLVNKMKLIGYGDFYNKLISIEYSSITKLRTITVKGLGEIKFDLKTNSTKFKPKGEKLSLRRYLAIIEDVLTHL